MFVKNLLQARASTVFTFRAIPEKVLHLINTKARAHSNPVSFKKPLITIIVAITFVSCTYSIIHGTFGPF